MARRARYRCPAAGGRSSTRPLGAAGVDTLARARMSESTSLYRRHRPGSFDEVVGQQHVVRTLRNAVEQGKVHHAYLFVGSRGTGKTSMAKILARSLNCERGGPTVTPCGECESCVTIAAGTSIDVIEMDAASNRSVDDVRDLRERVAYAPAGGHWKVYILDEAHMLTKEAWNAFLKTLEEPPPNTVFVLATTEAHKVMATIADRCQRFDFQRPSLEQISEVLNRVAAAESIEVDDGRGGDDRPLRPGQLPRRARHPRPAGRLRRRARSTSTTCWRCSAPPTPSCSSRRSTRSIAEDPKGVLLGVEKMARSGRDPSQFARDLLAHLRHLLVAQTIGEVPDHLRGHRHRRRAPAGPGERDRRRHPDPHDRRAGGRADRGARGRRRADGGRDRAAESRAAGPGSLHRGPAAPDRETRAEGRGAIGPAGPVAGGGAALRARRPRPPSAPPAADAPPADDPPPAEERLRSLRQPVPSHPQRRARSRAVRSRRRPPAGGTESRTLRRQSPLPETGPARPRALSLEEIRGSGRQSWRSWRRRPRLWPAPSRARAR